MPPESEPQVNVVPTGPFSTVVVPLDGSPDGETVLPTAKSLADLCGATLVLLHVVPYPETPAGHPSHGSTRGVCEEMPDDVVGAERNACSYLEGVRQRIGGQTEAVVRIGDPFTRIRSEVRDRERPVVVLTAKATAMLPSAHHSELARRLAFSRTAPVLVVPPPEA